MTKTTTAKTPKIENLDVKEALLAERYPERAIVVGSLLPADFEGNPFPGKQTLEITCCEPGCGAEPACGACDSSVAPAPTPDASAAKQTKGKVLILAPLAVAQQTVREAGIPPANP